MKVLTILIGNARGGEDTWNSMYKHLLHPLNSDLALCFGANEDTSSSLYYNAKYVWEVPEYKDWSEYYTKNCVGNWKNNFLKGKEAGLAGGIEDNIGSGAIIFAFRHYIKNNFKNIIKNYDQVILTRSDFFYIKDHPLLDLNYFWAVEGEDYGGITDRHHIFSYDDFDKALGVVEWLDSEDLSDIIGVDNPETILKKYYNFCGLSEKIKRFPRVQFTVATDLDSTRWKKAIRKMPGNNNLFLKYEEEYMQAIKNLNLYGEK